MGVQTAMTWSAANTVTDSVVTAVDTLMTSATPVGVRLLLGAGRQVVARCSRHMRTSLATCHALGPLMGGMDISGPCWEGSTASDEVRPCAGQVTSAVQALSAPLLPSQSWHDVHILLCSSCQHVVSEVARSSRLQHCCQAPNRAAAADMMRGRVAKSNSTVLLHK